MIATKIQRHGFNRLGGVTWNYPNGNYYRDFTLILLCFSDLKRENAGKWIQHVAKLSRNVRIENLNTF